MLVAFFYGGFSIATSMFAYSTEVDIIRTHITADQVYYVTVGVGVLASTLSVPFSVLCGFFSEPERCGRKTVILSLAILTAVVSGLAVKWPNQVWFVLLLRCVKLATMAVNPQLLLAWLTDNCTLEKKVSYFVVLTAFYSGGAAVSVTVSGTLKRHYQWSDQYMLFVSLCLAICSCFYCALFFPRSVAPTRSVIARRRSGLATSHAVRSSLTYILRWHPSVVLVQCALQFTSAGTVDSLALFLEKARGFQPEDVSMEMATVTWTGLALQSVIVPATRLIGLRLSSEVLLAVAACCAVVHMLSMGLLTDKVMIIALAPIGAMGSLGTAAASAIVSGEYRSHEDQGTLLGVFGALSSAAAAVGPVATAPLLTAASHWNSYAMGMPYVGLAVLMLPAVAVTFRLCCCHEKLFDSGSSPRTECVTTTDTGVEPSGT